MNRNWGVGFHWEHQWAGSTAADQGVDGTLDLDADGLSNLGEYLHGTDPRTPDTDRDGLTDGQEVVEGFHGVLLDGIYMTRAVDPVYHTDPSEPDTDGDGLKDGEEVLVYLSNASNPDTDGDGLGDLQEGLHHAYR